MKYGLRDCNGGKISSYIESTAVLKRIFELSIYIYTYLDFISLRLQPFHPEYNGYICYIPMKHEAFQVVKC